MKLVYFHSMIPRYLFVLLIILHTAKGAFENLGSGAEPLALGNAMVAFQENPYAIYYNPAHISSSRQSLIGFCYRTFFGLSSPGQINLFVNHCFKEIPISAGLVQIGDKNYQETQFLLGSSIGYLDKIRLGMSLSLYYLNIRYYSSAMTWGLNLGIHYPLNDHFTMGVLISNLNQPKLSSVEEKLPQTYALGFCYHPGAKMSFCFELFRDVRYEQDYRGGIVIDLKPGFSVRLGLEDKTNSYSLGVGLVIRKIRFDYTAVVHTILGLSQVTSIQIPL